MRRPERARSARALAADAARKKLDAPSAAAVNAVPDKDRAAALAALRVCGDIGLLTGAAALGGVAAFAGTDAAFLCASFGLVASAARFRWAAPVST